jgi:hypothetical protein
MAAQGDSHDEHGSMDISEHVKTWAGFTTFVKWSATGIAVVMVLLALFRTHG